ncbi:hypothetical protein CRP01_36565 [Flavilitoribacter nigricans DSM 23189 = NBRC 102662]|uniref:YCII-related domain-containing protein n=2 Tax=Flavilitoribacter TaxID=2762562 RepID=A0A2D0MZG8_FLAN2|nr:hypothetical protein CRP01_36565 [Flavilitoribacter nigricans DSM 23189 = NBRC 102662]
MQEYLVLMYGPGLDTREMETAEKMERYKTWGAYLAPFAADPDYRSGSPTRRVMRLSDPSNGTDRSDTKGMRLEGFMQLQARDLTHLRERLAGNPILAVEGAYLEIHELDPQGLISSKLPQG